MAAADLSRSRAAASRSTKGLFFISTLLCLLCFVSSSINKDQLENHKKDYLRFKQELDKLKEKHTTDSAMTSEIMTEQLTLMEQTTALAKKINRFSPDDLSSLETDMESKTADMKKTKDRVEDANEKLKGQIQNLEKDLARYQKVIQVLEEQQAEL